MKNIQLKFVRPSRAFGSFWGNVFSCGTWKVAGPVIGRVDGREVQELHEIIYAFSFFRLIYKPKNRYIYY